MSQNFKCKTYVLFCYVYDINDTSTTTFVRRMKVKKKHLRCQQKHNVVKQQQYVASV